MYRKDLLDTSYKGGGVDSVAFNQSMILEKLLSINVAGLLTDAVLAGEPESYAYANCLTDLTNGVFKEYLVGNGKPDVLRQGVQRNYLYLLETQLSERPPANWSLLLSRVKGTSTAPLRISNVTYSEYRGAALVNLNRLKEALSTALSGSTDPVERAHLSDCLVLIERAYAAARMKAS